MKGIPALSILALGLVSASAFAEPKGVIVVPLVSDSTAQGEAGPAGPPGPPGPAGADGVSGHEIVRTIQTTGDVGSVGVLFMDCTGSKKLLGGGYMSADAIATMDVWRNGPLNGDTRWAVYYNVLRAGRSVSGYAICANVTP